MTKRSISKKLKAIGIISILLVSGIIGAFATTTTTNDSSADTASTAKAVSFTDVSSGSWYYNTVTSMASKGVINGYPDGTFKPDGTITVAEFTKICVALLDDGNADFSAKAEEKWYTPYISKAVELGISFPAKYTGSGSYQGYDYLGNNFAAVADRPITREEMAVMVELAAEKVLKESNEYDVAVMGKMESKFITDMSAVYNFEKLSGSDYESNGYTQILRLAYYRGLVTGMGNNRFEPKGTATRAQAATMIARLTDKDSRVDNISALEAEIKSDNALVSELLKNGKTGSGNKLIEVVSKYTTETVEGINANAYSLHTGRTDNSEPSMPEKYIIMSAEDFDKKYPLKPIENSTNKKGYHISQIVNTAGRIYETSFNFGENFFKNAGVIRTDGYLKGGTNFTMTSPRLKVDDNYYIENGGYFFIPLNLDGTKWPSGDNHWDEDNWADTVIIVPDYWEYVSSKYKLIQTEY